MIDDELLNFARGLATTNLNEQLRKAAPIEGNGEVNRVYKLETTTRKVILRFNNIQEFDRFQKEQWCIETVLDKGVPGAPVLALGEIDRFAYMLLDFIEGENGKSIQSNPTLWEVLGKYLRLIHEVPVKGFGENLSDIKSGNLQQWKNYLTYNIESLNTDDELIKMGVLDNSTAGRLKSIFQNLGQKDFKFGLNHGDYSLANIIVDRQSLAHVIDWGSAQAHIVPHYDFSVILDESLSETSNEFKALLKGYGISETAFDDVKQDIANLHLLEMTDKLRWAIDRSPESIEHYKAKLTESLRSNVLFS